MFSIGKRPKPNLNTSLLFCKALGMRRSRLATKYRIGNMVRKLIQPRRLKCYKIHIHEVMVDKKANGFIFPTLMSWPIGSVTGKKPIPFFCFLVRRK